MSSENVTPAENPDMPAEPAEEAPAEVVVEEKTVVVEETVVTATPAADPVPASAETAQTSQPAAKKNKGCCTVM